MTSTNYLSVLPKKTIDKTTTNNIKEAWVKEWEEKWTKKITDAQGVATRATQKTVNRIAKGKFAIAYSKTTVSQDISSTDKFKQATMHTHWDIKVSTWDLEQKCIK